MVKAKDKKCIKCGARAVAFFPDVDPDIISYPYCRHCLDAVKIELMMSIYEPKDKK